MSRESGSLWRRTPTQSSLNCEGNDAVRDKGWSDNSWNDITQLFHLESVQGEDDLVALTAELNGDFERGAEKQEALVRSYDI